MKIKVTQEDIDEGMRADCQRCPVALALNRACPVKGGWYVGGQYASCAPQQHFELPLRVKTLIRDFDWRRRRIFPFTFELPIDNLLREVV